MNDKPSRRDLLLAITVIATAVAYLVWLQYDIPQRSAVPETSEYELEERDPCSGAPMYQCY